MAPDRNAERLEPPNPAGPSEPSAASRYAAEIVRGAALERDMRRRDASLSVARGAVFLIGVVAVIGAVTATLPGWSVIPPLLVFLAVAGWHEWIIDQRRVAAARRGVFERHAARLARDGAALPPARLELPREWAATADDLDLSGAGPFFQWLSSARTALGRETLARWLFAVPDLATIERRQACVARLARESAWRDALALAGEQLDHRDAAPAMFVDWATGPQWLARRAWMKWIARGMAVTFPTLGLLAWTGWLAPSSALAAAAIAWLVNTAISVAYSGSIHEIFQEISSESDEVRHYLAMLRVASMLPGDVGPVPNGDSDLRDVAREGIVRLTSLRRALILTRARHDTILAIVHIALQLFVLWEVHLLDRLERWQRRWGSRSPRWFAVIGELEALASLATVAFEQPDWVFPELRDDAREIRAEAIGHPLLPDSMRVANDLVIGPTDRCLLVTGSNMSGKSTLLRSVGVNILLANAGGVVCAARMVLPRCEPATSMHVRDSLTDHVSRFLAELRRLKEIVDRATEARRARRPFVFLLDEVLQGTNSRERRIAVAHVLRRLLSEGAIGAISTHDLELGADPELAKAFTMVHFRETITVEGETRRMTFDYRLRDGLCPTTNALVLLEWVGLGSARHVGTAKDDGPPLR